MANEAVIIELLGDRGDVIRYTCADDTAITKGALCFLIDPRTISGSTVLSAKGTTFAGIASQDKVASDGSTSIGLYTNGIFDLTTVQEPIQVGTLVCLSGANLITAATSVQVLSGAIIGKALETSSAGEVIAVRVGHTI